MNLRASLGLLTKISFREVASFLLIILISVSYIPIPLFLKRIVEQFQVSEINMSYLIQQCLILMAIFSFQAIGFVISRKILVGYIRTSIEEIRKRLLNGYLNSSEIPEEETISSIHKKIFAETEVIDRFYNSLLTDLLPATAIAMVTVILMFYISPILMAIVFLLSAITILCISYFKKKRDHALSAYYSTYEEFNKLILFLLKFKQLIVSQAMVKEEQARMEKNLSTLRDQGIKMEMGFTHAIGVQEFGQSVSLVIILLVSAWMRGSGLIELDVILIFLFLIYLLKRQFHTLSNHMQNIADGLLAMNRIAHLASKIKEPLSTDEKKRQVTFGGSLRFENISFHYPGHPLLFEKVNFSLAPGKITLLQGANGSGKSTLMRLILGYLHPNFGAITIEGVGANILDYDHFRHQVGVIFQDNELFEGTLKENLLYGVTPSETEMESKLAETGLKQWVEELPLRLDTPISELEEKISGGQKQRIVLARALLRNPKLLILDEPTNHLDADFRNTLLTLLTGLRNKMTILLISHNNEMENIADQILTINDTQIHTKS